MNRIFAPPRKKAKAPAAAARAAVQAPAPEDDVNLNRSGHLPTFRDVEEAIAEPEAAPEIVGRYSAGGANM